MIRAAKAADAAWICEIWNDVIRQTTATFTTQEKSTAEVEDLIAERQDAFLVDGGMGFATYGMFRGGPGYADVREHSIYLNNAARGQGRGRALLSDLERRAAARGVRFFVGAISGENDQAVRFHRSCGYSLVGRMPELGQKWDRRLDLVLVQKNLQDKD